MVRPKPSSDTLEIACAFAEVLTVRFVPRKRANPSGKVQCRGPNSIFGAIKRLLPHLVRVKNEPSKKGAVSEVQFNKHLMQVGFIPYRHRQRVLGASDKWSKGCQQWANIRWVDVSNTEETRRLRERLSDIALRFPKKFELSEESLFTFLASVAPPSTSPIPSRVESFRLHDQWPSTMVEYPFANAEHYLTHRVDCDWAEYHDKFSTAIFDHRRFDMSAEDRRERQDLSVPLTAHSQVQLYPQRHLSSPRMFDAPFSPLTNIFYQEL
jgi:hypothetical protein